MTRFCKICGVSIPIFGSENAIKFDDGWHCRTCAEHRRAKMQEAYKKDGETNQIH